jgi:hypothetical protein
MIDMPRSLIEEMAALADSDGWQHLVLQLDDRIESAKRSLLTGKLDHDGYLRRCESIRELEYVRDLPRALISSAHMRTGARSVHS